MGVFASTILQEYLKEYHEDNITNEEIHIYESEQVDDGVMVDYRIGEYVRYEDKDKKIFISITDLIDFVFMKFKKLESILNV